MSHEELFGFPLPEGVKARVAYADRGMHSNMLIRKCVHFEFEGKPILLSVAWGDGLHATGPVQYPEAVELAWWSKDEVKPDLDPEGWVPVAAVYDLVRLIPTAPAPIDVFIRRVIKNHREKRQ